MFKRAMASRSDRIFKAPPVFLSNSFIPALVSWLFSRSPTLMFSESLTWRVLTILVSIVSVLGYAIWQPLLLARLDYVGYALAFI